MHTVPSLHLLICLFSLNSKLFNSCGNFAKSFNTYKIINLKLTLTEKDKDICILKKEVALSFSVISRPLSSTVPKYRSEEKLRVQASNVNLQLIPHHWCTSHVTPSGYNAAADSRLPLTQYGWKDNANSTVVPQNISSSGSRGQTLSPVIV